MWTKSSLHEGPSRTGLLTHHSLQSAPGTFVFVSFFLLAALTMGESAWHRTLSSVTSWEAWGQRSLWAARPWPPRRWVSALRPVPKGRDPTRSPASSSKGGVGATRSPASPLSSPLLWLHLLSTQSGAWSTPAKPQQSPGMWLGVGFGLVWAGSRRF